MHLQRAADEVDFGMGKAKGGDSTCTVVHRETEHSRQTAPSKSVNGKQAFFFVSFREIFDRNSQ